MTESGAQGATARWTESLWQDVRFGVRALLQNPGVPIAALLALALGIGANTAVFSVARATLWRELPYRDPEGLVVAEQELPSLERAYPATFETFDAWRRRSRSFESLASLSSDSANLTGPGEPALVSKAWVTANFFDVAGMKMAAGRGFREGETRRKDRVAVISYPLFQERYQGDPARLRRGIILDGDRYAVVGVAPPGVELFGVHEVWVPDSLRPSPEDPTHHSLNVLGRLRPGITLERLDRELEAVTLDLAKETPGAYEGLTVRVTPLPGYQGEEIRGTLEILAVFVACILLIACADVAGLLLALATGREREIALRAALGAGRGRLVRRLVAESLLLCLPGGLLGLPLAILGARGLVALDPEAPSASDVQLSGGALLLTLGVSMATGLVCGLAPAVTATGRRLTESLKDARRLAGRPAGRATRNLLLAVQMALTVVLIVGAVLFKEGFDRLRGVDLGFQPAGLLMFDVQLPTEKYNDAGTRSRIYQEVLREVRKVPGTDAAALVCRPLFSQAYRVQFTIEGVPLPDSSQKFPVVARRVSPGYLRTLGIPLLRGRDFRDSDRIGTQRVVIINEAMANRSWPGEDPIGKRFTYGFGPIEEPDLLMTVIGVAKDARERRFQGPPEPSAYSLLHQEQRTFATQAFSVLVRASGDPLDWAGPARDAVRKADPALAPGPARRVEDIASESIARNRFQSLLGQLFAGLALILAVVGIYSVVSYSVARRTHEIGVRVALGAQSGDVLRRVIFQGMAPILAGLVLGLAAARFLLGFLEGQLYEVSLGDPLPYVVAAVVVLGAGLFATYFPAHRATQVDPMAALREE
jgi:putative ABC transport system permease protein